MNFASDGVADRKTLSRRQMSDDRGKKFMGALVAVFEGAAEQAELFGAFGA